MDGAAEGKTHAESYACTKWTRSGGISLASCDARHMTLTPHPWLITAQLDPTPRILPRIDFWLNGCSQTPLHTTPYPI
ncbi:hypothetical protein RRG08_027850 [Elysia crispata]|uniref:Uncharacterized protein n=1 Tax=Elysia crispata TaxID=231223 RepID=A0AAE1D4E8_9GAST|nr:hypothetical protein RRG08_027850 [Elysia crispata]